MKNFFNNIGKNWLVFGIAGFMVLPFLGAWFLSETDVRAHLVITRAEIEDHIKGETSDDYSVLFVMESSG